MPASTPPVPYYAVIFTNTLTDNPSGYEEMANRMYQLAQTMDGFLGFESARDSLGISVSYWKDLESIKNWKQNLEHQHAQALGKEMFYSKYMVRIAKVEKDYIFEKEL